MKKLDLQQIELYLSSGNGIKPDRVSVRADELSALLAELRSTRAALAEAEAKIEKALRGVIFIQAHTASDSPAGIALAGIRGTLTPLEAQSE